ncbi:hypothetical protein BEWA_038550 [Theileria equi strain WA]|uniref:Uncharacterized protein n=1 Tax=Theileria equi strain WA TaxID=1537102 RepID=L1LEH5_THEEQ|nr:hypothetical protein BEWA_038550 [Theileria equi strain WA]EKX73817.1 hypothetical protein BEWA_038550 [Theileria equi strain WA]|eukprot:XP_004833269.1 hypothetical protein BEWA_038550 [Theileria equi strain WA]
MSENTVEIDIGKTPDGDDGEVKSDDGGNNKYYYDDKSARKRVKITVTKHIDNLPGYVTLTYSPYQSGTQITSIKDSKSQTKFNDSTNDCKSVTVYYWSGDDYSKPIIILLGPVKKYYKTTTINNEWTNTNIQSGGLINLLETESCRRNITHVIDISRNSGPYNCPNCGSKQVGVNNYSIKDDTTEYSYYYHRNLTGYFIRGFNDGKTEQTGLTLTGIISAAYVYHNPSGPEGIPLLMNYSSNWFERKSLESNRWTEVEGGNKPGSNNDDPKILKLLKAKLPTVTIDVGRTEIRGGNPGTYQDPDSSGGVTYTIKFTKEEVDSDYTTFTHCIKGKTYFVARYVKYSSSPLQGIPPNLVVKNVTAYYYGDNPSDENLLLVEVEKRGTGPLNYVYYSKKGKDSKWTDYPRSGTKLENPELKKTLDALRNAHFPESPTTTIIGSSVGTGLGGAGLGALAVWKGPSLLARLITRM